MSGTLPLQDRPGLSAALQDARDLVPCALVVARTDQLARDTLTALLIEKEFMEAGVGVLYDEGAARTQAGVTLDMGTRSVLVNAHWRDGVRPACRPRI